MIKTKMMWRFFNNYFFYNHFFIIWAFFLMLANIGVHISLQLIIGDSVIAFNKQSFIIIQTNIIISLILLSLITYFLFSASKTNDFQKFLLLSPFSRKKLFIYKSCYVFYLFLCLSLFQFSIKIIFSVVFSDSYFVFMDLALLALDAVLACFFIPIFIFIAIFFKNIIFTIMALIITLIVPVTFFLARFFSVINENDKLNYQFNTNQNNYLKLNVMDKNNKVEKQYLLGLRNYEEQVNQNQYNSFNDAINPTKNNFQKYMLGNIFNQFVADFIPQPDYNFADLYKLSEQDYTFNLNLITTNNYKSGDPTEISMNSNNYFTYLAFQDQDPFLMDYQTILENIKQIIADLDLTNDKNLILIDSIFKKTSNNSSWKDIQFAPEELNILQTFAGQNEHWLFYILKYKNLFTNKLVKLYDDLTGLYGEKIGAFSEFLWKSDTFAINVANYYSILDINFIKNNFPDIGYSDLKKQANIFDIDYFKNDLIHFDNVNGTNITKVWTINNAYEKIDLDFFTNSFLKTPLSNQTDWNNYIDANKEIGNLTRIYNEIFRMNQEIAPSYQFQNNNYDLYGVDKVLVIKSKKWINKTYIIIIILLTTGLAINFITFKLNQKWGVKHA